MSNVDNETVRAVSDLDDFEEMKVLVAELFRLLSIEEESDSGRMFKPNYISSCRALDGERISIILQRLKELI